MDQVFKSHELTIDISPNRRQRIQTGTEFFTLDQKTGKKIVNFTLNNEELDLTTAKNVVFAFNFVSSVSTYIFDSNETKFERKVEIEDAEKGRVSLVLPNDLFEYEGPVIIYIYIEFINGQSFDVAEIETTFTESFLDKQLPEMTDFYVARFEDLIKLVYKRIDEINSYLNERVDEIDQHVDNRLDIIDSTINNRIDAIDLEITNRVEEINHQMQADLSDSREELQETRNELQETKLDLEKTIDAFRYHVDELIKQNQQQIDDANIRADEIEKRLDNLDIISREDFNIHVNDSTRHVTANERQDWNSRVTQNTFNDLPIRRRIQVTDWDALDNTVLGLRHGESVMVYADIGSLNSPWNGINSMSGHAYLTSNNGDHIAIEVYRSSNTVTRDRKAMRFRGFNGWGEWKYGADTATRLQTPRTINDVAFDGTTNITVTANPTTTRLTVNTNLNDVLTPGNYNCPLIDEATTMPNTPLNEAFSLQVIRHGGNVREACTQIFTTYHESSGRIRRFIRNQNGTVWGAWFELPIAVGAVRTYDMSVTRANQLATERTITIGNTSKIFNGSADVNWSINEILGLIANGNADAGSARIGNLLINWGTATLRFVGTQTGYYEGLVEFRESYTSEPLVLATAGASTTDLVFPAVKVVSRTTTDALLRGTDLQAFVQSYTANWLAIGIIN